MGTVTKTETFTRKVQYHVCDRCGIESEKIPDGWWELINVGTKRNEFLAGPGTKLLCGKCASPLTGAN